MYHWAKLSDRIGRKPVLLCGLLGVAVSIAGLCVPPPSAADISGLATSFWAALLLRSLAGAWCGNVAVIKASLGDITDESNATDAFALYGLTWTIGGTLGTALGGGLARPADRWPEAFAAPLWHTHPYFLRERGAERADGSMPRRVRRDRCGHPLRGGHVRRVA